jgi:hypothetical protein
MSAAGKPLATGRSQRWLTCSLQLRIGALALEVAMPGVPELLMRGLLLQKPTVNISYYHKL